MPICHHRQHSWEHVFYSRAASTHSGRGTLSEPAIAAVETPDKQPAEPAPKKGRGRKPSTAKKTRTVELTLTVTGTADGEWQADLLHAGKRVVQDLSIPAAAVSKAAAELHQDISEVIETVLGAARQQHEAKLAELEAEVNRVRKALAELES
jgi:polyhydroxyalkanoate synthesis regulator phasin